MSKLLFFTQNYPFENGDTFIENEIEYLAAAFDEVVILPWIGQGPQTRKVPANCKVLKPLLKNDRDTILSGIFCLAPIGYFIRHYFSDKAYTRLSKTIKYISVSTFCRAILSKKAFKEVNEAFRNETCYFYWGIGTGYLLPFIKNKTRKIVRFHRADIFLDARKDGYIPFRTEVYSNLSKAVFISQTGLEHALEHHGHIPFKAYVSYLGTKDRGTCSAPKPDNRLYLLSCSHVVPVKRLHLILEALREIHDREMVWTHIGGGKLMDELKAAASLPQKNLEIRFTGPMLNQEVIRYYQTHPFDIFINVSSSEGVPVAIMEAISFDIPVIATRVGGTAEVVTEEVGQLIDSDFSPELLAEEIRNFDCKKYSPRKFWEEHFRADTNYPDFIDRILLPE